LGSSSSYRIARGIELLFEAADLTDAPLSLYQGIAATSLQHEVYGRTFGFGLKGRF
jgi:hypothetical protein